MCVRVHVDRGRVAASCVPCVSLSVHMAVLYDRSVKYEIKRKQHGPTALPSLVEFSSASRLVYLYAGAHTGGGPPGGGARAATKKSKMKNTNL